MITPDLSFECAAEIWWREHKETLRPRTQEVYRSYLRKLNEFFREVELWRIDITMIRAYQQRRALAARKPEGRNHSATNHEVECVLAVLLRRAGLWKHVKADYRRVPEPSWQPPKVMTDAEEERLFRVAESNPDWAIAYWVASITCNTTASGQELRLLRLRDVDLGAPARSTQSYGTDSPPLAPDSADGPPKGLDYKETYAENAKFRVPARGAKNKYRERVIPLNEVAFLQFQRVLDRARRLGAWHPDHYIFPFCEGPGRYDVTRPASSSFLRTSFRNLKIAADMMWLTPHCFRHHSITKMLEAGVPEQTVMSVAGHVSRQMLEHYSHTRIQAKRQALNVLVHGGRLA